MADYTQEQMEEKLYGLYQLDWMMAHGYGLKDVWNVMTKDAEDAVTPQDAIEYFEERGFQDELYALREEFRTAELQDPDYIHGLIEKSDDKEELQKAYHEYIEKSITEVHTQLHPISDKEKEQRLEVILRHAAEGVCRRSGGELLAEDAIVIPAMPNPGDHLEPHEIEEILTCDHPKEMLKGIAQNKYGNISGVEIADYIIDSFEGDLSSEEYEFLKSYEEEFGYDPELDDVALFFNHYDVSSEYVLQESPILHQEVPLDILYGTSEPALDDQLLRPEAPIEKDAPLMLLAKQQGVQKPFLEVLNKDRRGEENFKIEDPLVKELYYEACEASYDSKLTFLASAPLKDCIKIAEAKNKGKGTIELPKGVVAGEYNFSHGNGGRFGIESTKQLIQLPIKDIQLHHDKAKLYPNKYYSIASNLSKDAWKHGVRLQKTAKQQKQEKGMTR